MRAAVTSRGCRDPPAAAASRASVNAEPHRSQGPRVAHAEPRGGLVRAERNASCASCESQTHRLGRTQAPRQFFSGRQRKECSTQTLKTSEFRLLLKERTRESEGQVGAVKGDYAEAKSFRKCCFANMRRKVWGRRQRGCLDTRRGSLSRANLTPETVFTAN